MGEFKKNTNFNNYLFVMIDSANRPAGKTGLTPAIQISKDGAAFVAAINAPVEIGDGMYKLVLDATEMNVNSLGILITAVGADDWRDVIYTVVATQEDIRTAINAFPLDYLAAETRIVSGAAEKIYFLLYDADGNPVTGLTGAQLNMVNLMRSSDSKYWDGNSWEDAASDLAATEVDATNSPGLYSYTTPELDTGEYIVTIDSNDASNVPQSGTIKAGEYLDSLVTLEDIITGSNAGTLNLNVITGSLSGSSGQKIDIYRGDDLTIPVSVKDSNDAAVNIIGAAIKFSVKSNISDTGYIFQRSSGDASQIDITDGANGVLEVYLVPSNTQNLTPGIYQYDVEIILDGKVSTIVKGELKVLAEVTRP